MNKNDYIIIASEKLSGNANKIMLEQIEKYYKAKEYMLPNCYICNLDGVVIK